MRSKWMWLIAVMILVILGCLTMRSVKERSQSELVVRAGRNCIAERLDRSENVEERFGWREGVGEWRRKGRPYRNPLRRYRVSKKVRMQLRRRLAGMDEKRERIASFCKKAEAERNVERALVAEASVESGRWG